MEYLEETAKLCVACEQLKLGRRLAAISAALPVLKLLDEQLVGAIKNAPELQLAFRRLYISDQVHWTVLRSHGLTNGPVSDVTTLGWNMRFDDEFDHRTLLGSLIRSAKQYGLNDPPPDILSIRALAALATIAAARIRNETNFNLVTSVPSSKGSINKLPATVARMVAERLLCEIASPASIWYVRETRKLKEIPSHQEKLMEISGVIRADPDRFAGQTVLVIDDMLETGATIQETARALRSAGALDVSALTLARTRKFAKETVDHHVHD